MRRLLLLLFIIFMPTIKISAAEGDSLSTKSLLSSGTWVKIRVEKPGVYQLSHSSLRSMGFSTPDRVKLYGLNVEVVPETGLFGDEGDLQELPLYRMSDKLLFYARGTTQWTLQTSKGVTSFTHFNNPYSKYKYYLLTEGDSPMDFPTYSYETGSDAHETTDFPDYSLIESDGYSFMNSGRTFFESYDYQSGNSRNYNLDLPGLSDRGRVRLDVQFCAAGTTASELEVSLNDTVIGSITIPKLGNYDHGILRSGSFSVNEGVKTKNTVKLVHSRLSGIPGHLDYIRATYDRKLQLDGDYLLFRPDTDGDVVFKVSGASDGTVVWRVSRDGEVESVKGSVSSGVLSVPFTSESEDFTWMDEELVALNPSSTFPSPSVVGKIANQDLRSLSNLDLVIVVPANGKYVSQAQRLADAHTTYDSLRSVVLTIDKVYNEFSGGTPDATALRLFMKMLYDKASDESNRPKNLLLFGDGVWDNRMVTGALQSKSPDDYLLCYESDNSLSKTESYVLEEYYGLVDDNIRNIANGIPRIGVGRLPVSSTHQAKGVVDKLIAYISNKEVGSWKNLLCFICDDGNNNLHMDDGETVINSLKPYTSDFRIRRIYTDTYERETTATGSHYPNAKADIDKVMLDGALVMDYTGHGAPGQLAHEQLMVNKDFTTWSSTRLPLWFTAACDVAPFDMNKDNIGESAILNIGGCAMGFIGTTRTVYSNPNRQMNIQFMKNVLSIDANGNQLTIGEALAKAKGDLTLMGSSTINRIMYVLLGDPAIKLAIPFYNIVIDEINGKSTADGESESVYAGELVTVKGHIETRGGEPDDNFNGWIYPTILDNEELVTCLNNSKGETNGNDANIEPFQFYSRTKTLYSVVDSVKNGSFTFRFPVPLDNNYSGENGQISLYATNSDHSHEANGGNTQFKIAGTSDSISTDTIGPAITPIYLNTDQFKSGDIVNETPLLMAYLSDKDGINMTGSGIGHDIEAMIDNDESTTYSLNSYFTTTPGDYSSGKVEFSLPTLPDGHHTLTIRAYDILNNPSTGTIDFYVNTGAKPKIFSLDINTPTSDNVLFTISNDRPQTNLTISLQIYDVSGRLIYRTSETQFSPTTSYTFNWNMNENESHLVPGVYIVKAGISTANGPIATETKKFVIVRKKP